MAFTKFAFWLKTLCVLNLISSFILTATAQNYYPAEVGNTWVFQNNRNERRTYTFEGPENINGKELIVLKITNEALGTDTTVDAYFITVESNGGLILHQSAIDQGDFGIAKATFHPPVTFFPTDLPLGRTWEIVTKSKLKLVGAVTITSTMTVIAIEDVETTMGI